MKFTEKPKIGRGLRIAIVVVLSFASADQALASLPPKNEEVIASQCRDEISKILSKVPNTTRRCVNGVSEDDSFHLIRCALNKKLIMRHLKNNGFEYCSSLLDGFDVIDVTIPKSQTEKINNPAAD